MAEIAARLVAVERERDALRVEVERLKDQLAVFDPIFAIRCSLPDHDAAMKLRRIVVSRYPFLKEQASSEDEAISGFIATMAFISSLTVVSEPVTRFSTGWWISECEQWCSKARLSGRTRTLLPAIIALDVPYHLDHGSLFLDPYRSKGTAVDRGAWRRILAGGDLKQAIPVKQQTVDGSIGFRRELARSW